MRVKVGPVHQLSKFYAHHLLLQPNNQFSCRMMWLWTRVSRCDLLRNSKILYPRAAFILIFSNVHRQTAKLSKTKNVYELVVVLFVKK